MLAGAPACTPQKPAAGPLAERSAAGLEQVAVIIRSGSRVHRFVAEVARSPEEQAVGLMHRQSLAPDRAMLFPYDPPQPASFWMKNTLIPLSIAFVDEAGRVIEIRDMEPCAAEPCPMYGADAPFVLAVEANLGWFEEAGVEVGARAELGGDPSGG